MKTFPTLYKKTSTGAIQEWTIKVRGHPDWYPDVAVYTWHGQVGGKIQETFDIIKEGKNIGKKNETTAEQQGIAEAKAKWGKQKKKGYVESIEAAQAGEVDSSITGGIEPMLAHKFKDHSHKIKYPCYVQPKLDGIRCIAILENGKCTLWSRTRKPITGVPHIARILEEAYPTQKRLVLDGELYNHEFKKDFEKIVSFVRQEEPKSGHEIVQYHVYDVIIENYPFYERRKLLYGLGLYELVAVETNVVNNEDELTEAFDHFISLGYEGAMVRNADGLYVNKRSYDLQKIKEMEDSEFDIVGVEEGRGKLVGHAIFVCKMKDGKEFKAKMKGETSKLKEYFENHNLWKNKQLTVQYQGLTVYGIPRFPVGKAIRDYE